MSEPEPLPPQSRTLRARLGWVVVGVAGAAIIASFALSSDDDAAAERGRGPRATPVAVVPIERATITERGRYPGELDADSADVSSFYTGRLRAVHVRVGDLVKAGDPVAEIDPVDAQAQISRARAQAQAASAEEKRAAIELEAARRELARYEKLSDQVSALELDARRAGTQALESAVATAAARGAEARAGVQLLQKRVVESVIRAPFDGRVAARHVDPGAIVNAGEPLVRIVATGPMHVRFEVPEQDVLGIEVGTRLRVVTQTGSEGQEVSVPASVTGIGGEVSRDRRVATIEALVAEPPSGWLTGMFADVVVDRRTIEGATVVPSSAVLSRMQPTGEIATGVLVADENVARWVPVAVVAREADRVAIKSSDRRLAIGAPVLVAGHIDLADGGAIIISGADETAAESG